MKKWMHTAIYIAHPFIFSVIFVIMMITSPSSFFYHIHIVGFDESIAAVFFGLCYVGTIYGLYSYSVKRFFNPWILPVGFIPTPVL